MKLMNGWLLHFETGGLVKLISPGELRKKLQAASHLAARQ
jgi:hypothetical protein